MFVILSGAKTCLHLVDFQWRMMMMIWVCERRRGVDNGDDDDDVGV